jgi:hypothetical protein
MRQALVRSTLLPAAAAILACTMSSQSSTNAPADPEGLAAFATVQRVLQHPRCQNCHIPGDAPLQFDDGRVHSQNVLRGPAGRGAAGLQCSACHAEKNPPASYGPHVPPGAPGWRLPPPGDRMVFLSLSAHDLAAQLKDPVRTGGRDLSALLDHVTHDPLVLWGWSPGPGRAPVDVPHDEFVRAFKRWIEHGAPVPAR